MKPTPEFVRNIVDAYYRLPGNTVGGNLHIVVEDLNLESENILWCLERARKHEDTNSIFLALLLLQFSDEEREYIFQCDGVKCLTY